MLEQRNLIFAVVASVAILLAYEYLYEVPRLESLQRAQEQSDVSGQKAAGQKAVPARPGGAPDAARPPVPGAPPSPNAPAPELRRSENRAESRATALAAMPRLAIRSARLKGSISLAGARIDDLTLSDYRETLEEDSAKVVLLSPTGGETAYYAQFNWVADDRDIALPKDDTLWRADRNTLTPETPVTLHWDNGKGLRFVTRYALDENYMFTVTQRVENHGKSAVTLYPYGLVSRTGTPEVTRFWILHEGLIGVFNKTLKEIDYDDLQDDRVIQETTTGGWIGITDKYWLAAVIPDPTEPATARFSYWKSDGRDHYQTDMLGGAIKLAPGATAETVNRLFAGAKEVRLLDRYEAELSVDRFDLAVDFGWFYFLTKPIFYVLDYFYDWLGNFGLAIFLLTVLIKVLFFPLANKSYRSMSKMKQLQPEIVKLRERFKDDRARVNQEMMTLYRERKINPASGCLPILVQVPVFFALYKVLFVTIEMRHTPFYGWIKDLSAPDPTTLFNLFGLIPYDPPSFMMIGAWPIIMGASMFLQTKLNPQPADPMQAKLFLFLPLIFTVFLAQFPAGLVIYWAWNNTLSIAQQWVIMRRTRLTS